MFAIAVLATLASARLEMAYLGRYYYKPGSGKTSSYHVYATDLHGRRRVRLSALPVGATTQVIWSDKDTVAWNDHRLKWWLYNVRTGRRWSASAVSKQNRAEPWPRNAWEDKGTVVYKRQPPITWSTGDDGASLALARGGVRLGASGSDGRAVGVVPTQNPSQTLAVFWLGSANGMGDEDEVLLVDWKKRKVSPWRRHVKETQFFPDRDLFLARHEGRDIIPYGSYGSVWVDSIYAGTMSGNKMWTVVGGTVWCGTPVLRPD